MCGFVGFTGLREQREAILHRMADRIIHRGPDMEGYHISGNDPRSAIALGFRRLSIIDLAAGKQPMYNEDGTVVCVFNGEIYNFMELRTELQAKGHIFQTHCDTEVILHGYEEYGTKLAGMLRGMFAFVVWDTKTNEMYGARDIFGIKRSTTPRRRRVSCSSAAKSRACWSTPVSAGRSTPRRCAPT